MSPDSLLLDQARISEQHGAIDMALEIYRVLLADHPDDVDLLLHVGVAFARLQRHAAAADTFRRATVLRPEQGDSHILLGHSLQDLGQRQDAILPYARATRISPDAAEPAFQLGGVLQALNAQTGAIEAYHHALAIDPQSAKTFANLATCAASHGHFDDAITFGRRSLRLNREAALTWSNLGVALGKRGHDAEALKALETALVLDPAHPEILYNLGTVLNRADRHEAAIAAYRKAVQVRPHFARAHDNLGVSFHSLGRIEESIAAHRHAIALAPDAAEAHFNLAHSLLAAGHYEQGFDEFEWRWRLAEFPSPKRDFSQPLWNGAPFPGRTLLVHAEQGMGDTIQFCRYIPEIAARGGRVILECPAALAPLLGCLSGVSEMVESDRPLPPFDLHAPIFSLPKIFRTTLATIPGPKGYLQSDLDRSRRWKSLVGAIANLKVGLVWAGNPGHGNDRKRSISWPVLQSANWPRGVALFNLQKGRSQPGITLGDGIALIDLASGIADFADFAAAIAAMDLVISVDTAAAHLAGALGQAVWTLLPFAPDWRWGRKETTTPWYPTMRLFRQDTPADWEGVLDQVTTTLATMAARQNLRSATLKKRSLRVAKSEEKPHL